MMRIVEEADESIAFLYSYRGMSQPDQRNKHTI